MTLLTVKQGNKIERLEYVCLLLFDTNYCIKERLFYKCATHTNILGFRFLITTQYILN
jgi:hypothetical protein